jgi:hypothetical protein
VNAVFGSAQEEEEAVEAQAHMMPEWTSIRRRCVTAVRPWVDVWVPLTQMMPWRTAFVVRNAVGEASSLTDAGEAGTGARRDSWFHEFFDGVLSPDSCWYGGLPIKGSAECV